MDKEIIETRTCLISLDENGIVRAVQQPNRGTQILEDAVENIEVTKTILKGSRAPLFCDYRLVQGQTRGCQMYYAGTETAKAVIACAILIESPHSKLLTNFYLGLRKPIIPTRLFTSESEAFDWL